MIKQTYGQWKLNNDRDSRNIFVATMVYCVIVFLFKFFVLAPIKDYFTKHPLKKENKIEKRIKASLSSFTRNNVEITYNQSI